jgi:hypothetical protein
MSDSSQPKEHACESMCFFCKIQPGIPTCKHSSNEFAKPDSLEIPVQISGDPDDLKTDKLYEMIKRGEISIQNLLATQVRFP